MLGTGPSMTEVGFQDFANKLNPAPLRRSRVFLAQFQLRRALSARGSKRRLRQSG